MCTQGAPPSEPEPVSLCEPDEATGFEVRAEAAAAGEGMHVGYMGNGCGVRQAYPYEPNNTPMMSVGRVLLSYVT